MPYSLIVIGVILIVLVICLCFAEMIGGAGGSVAGGGAWLVDDNSNQTPEQIYEGYKEFVEQAKDVMEKQAKDALKDTVTGFCDGDTTAPRKIIQYIDKSHNNTFYPAKGADRTINSWIDAFGTDDYADYMSLLFVLMTREKQQADGVSDGEIYDFDFKREDFEEFMKTVKLYRVLNEYGGGKGTAENPYIISYYDQLLRLSEQGAKGYFIQTADIAFPRNTDRNPISTKKITRGYENKSYDYFVYDGQGHSIKNVSGSGGLFGAVAAGTIQNVVVDGANIKAGKNKNLGVICNEIVSYAYPSTDTDEYFSTGNTRIIGCKVLNSKITADGAENIGGICGFGGDISDCMADGITVSGGKSIGGIVGNACTVTGCIANNITVSGSAVSLGGIAGTAYGVELFNSGEKPHCAGGSIIGCGVRTFTSTAENSGGIVGTATAYNVSAYIKSCLSQRISTKSSAMPFSEVISPSARLNIRA